MTTLSPRTNGSNPTSQICVRTECAGDYLPSLGLGDIALVKMDVEGHEAVILASMRTWLAEVRPPVILFECNLDGSRFHEHPSVRLLCGLGYRFFGIDMKPLWHTRLYAVKEDAHPIGQDFVAVRWQGLDEDRRHGLEAMLA
jgi:hypothetical protein